MVSVVLLVIGIGLVIAIVLALILVPFIVRWQRGSATYWADFDRQVLTSGEQVVLPRESAVYRAGTGDFSKVKGNGQLTLTDRRLAFRKVTGGVVEIPTGRITGAHRAKVFLRSVAGGHEHLVVELAGGDEVGFFVTDLDRWLDTIHRLVTGGPA